MKAMNGSKIKPRIISNGSFSIGQVFSHHTHPADKYIIARKDGKVRWQDTNKEHKWHCGPLASLKGEAYELSLTRGRGMDGVVRI